VSGKLRKEIIGFGMAVCPSARLFVRVKQLGSNWTLFYAT